MPHLRLLVLEDRPEDAALMVAELQRSGFTLDWQRVDTEDAYRRHLDPPPDLILADFNMPQFTAARALEILKDRRVDIPFIIVSGSIGEDVAVNALQDGAADYLLKDRLTRLGPAARRALDEKELREKKRVADETLRASEQQFRSLFEGVPLGLYRSTPDGRLLDVNPAMVRMLGYPDRESLLAVNAAVLYVDPSERQTWTQPLEARGVLIDYENRLRRHDGTIIWVRGTAHVVRDNAGRVLYYNGTLEDITARRQVEEELDAERTLLRTLIDTLPDFINIKDAGGRYRLVNRAYTEFLGASGPEDIIGKTVFDVFPRELATGYADDDRNVLETGQPMINKETIARTRDDRQQWHVVSKIPLRDGTGQMTGLVGVARDITDRKAAEERIEEQLRQLQALRHIDIAITASLDLRVTLNVILDQATTHLRADAANVLLFDPHTQTLRHVTNRGFRTTALRHANLRLGEGHAGQAALEQHTVSVPDLAANPREFARSAQLPGEGFVAYHAVPLIAKGQVKGVLEIFHRSPLRPTPEWLAFLDALAGQAAIAVDNSSLFENLQRANTDLVIAYDTTLEGWSRALDLRDKETEGHTLRVTQLTVRLAHGMDVRDADLVHVRRGALLHDIGKMGIPDGILLKPGPLTDDEWVVMKKHPTYAYELLSPIPYLRLALDIPYCHHEKWDGTGYPRGLKGDAIPLAARIFAIADVYDALTSDRPYRPAWSREKTLAHIREQAGTHFDPRIVDAFLALINSTPA